MAGAVSVHDERALVAALVARVAYERHLLHFFRSPLAAFFGAGRAPGFAAAGFAPAGFLDGFAAGRLAAAFGAAAPRDGGFLGDFDAPATTAEAAGS